MNIYALGESFETLNVGLNFLNLQWNRRYYECGDFTIQVQAADFDEKWAYIGTPERPELGRVQRMQTDTKTDTVLLSGFFAESFLDDKVCYPRFVMTGNIEEVCHRIFRKYAAGIPVWEGEPNSPLLGDGYSADFTDDRLGKKLYSMLATRELSQRVRYEYESNRLEWEVWAGTDRTQAQDVNPFYTFSSAFGNIKNAEVTTDDSAYRNYAIIPANADDAGIEQTVAYVDWSGGGYRREMVLNKRSSRPEKGQTEAQFVAALESEGAEKLLDYQKIEELDVDAIGTGYMTNWDLGDRVDVLIDRPSMAVESRIVEVMEVFKPGVHTVTVGFGNKRVSNRARR